MSPYIILRQYLFVDDCIFCKIIDEEIPSFQVYEDELCVAFLDVNPIKRGHLLLVPKEHVEFIWQTTALVYQHLFNTAKILAKLMQDTFNPKTVGLAIEGLEVNHTHIHLVPVTQGYDLDPNKAKPASPEELKVVLEELIATYDNKLVKDV